MKDLFIFILALPVAAVMLIIRLWPLWIALIAFKLLGVF